MVFSFPSSDTLHLLDLGIMRRCMFRWVFGAKGYGKKWSNVKTSTISRLFASYRKYMPSEIHRAIRTLDSLRKWKGVEYRTILMYAGMVAFKDILDDAEYNHFLIVSMATRMCCSRMYKEFLPLAEKMFRIYVEKYADIYGRHTIGSNVHLLIHIVEDMRKNKIDNLMVISTYKFENCLRHIGLKLKHGYLPLEQVSRRIIERSKIQKQSGTNQFEMQQYSPQLLYKNKNGSMTYDTISICLDVKFSNRKLGDSFFLTKNNQLVEFKHAQKEGNSYEIVGFPIEDRNPFFRNPLNSNNLNIYLSDGKTFESCTFKISDIFSKMICLPYQSKFVFIPLEHTIDSLSVL